MRPDDQKYFIIMAKPPSPNGYLCPGQICYIDKKRYEDRQKRNSCTILPVTCIGKIIENELEAGLLQKLSRRAAEFLLALEKNEERLMALADAEAFLTNLTLSEGSQVYVELNNKWLTGVIRYIGTMTFNRTLDPIAGVFFGVELQVSSLYA